MSDTCCRAGQGAHHDHTHAHAAAAAALDAVDAPQTIGADVRTSMRIMQMDCPTEESLIRKKLQGMAEVRGVQFNLMQRVLTVQHRPDGLDAVLSALRSLGFQPELPDGDRALAPVSEQPRAGRGWHLLALAGLAAFGAEAVHWSGGPSWAGLALAMIAILLSGWSTYKKGLLALVNRNLNINALMSIAVTGALVLGQWPEAAMVMVLFSIAEAIEARSLDRARRSVEQLMDVAPETVSVRQADGSWHTVRAAELLPGAVVRVRPGERIGLDGVVTAGRSEINQAPITGESALQPKEEGDIVYAGSINGLGELEYEVTAAANDTMLARIVHTVHDAQSRKAPIQRFVDRFAAVYTPIVCVLAVLVAVLPPLIMGVSWYDAVYTALVLLVIACPCALVISTPIAVVSALGAAARQGILIKGGVYLEQARHLKWLALDKTGTLTTGEPSLLDVIVLNHDMDPAACMLLAHRLASRSDHPVSRAIALGLAPQLAHANLESSEVRDVSAVLGKGAQARVDGKVHFLGSPAWITEIVPGALADAYHDALAAEQAQGRTISVLANEQGALAAFVVADSLRPSTREALDDVHSLGVKTLMLSGDTAAAAHHVGRGAGLDAVRAELLPHEKLAVIEELMAQGVTGMVGDGINDAPALARADIGFAMGAAGTDTAIETADVALMDDDLRKLGRFIRLSRVTHRILVQNITVALGIKAVFVIVTLMGLATMWMAVFADVGASLIVVANSLRLLRVPGTAPGTARGTGILATS